MKLIKISNEILVNPDKISKVEIRGKKILVTVDGETHQVEIPQAQLLIELKNSGVNLNQQFFAV